LIGWVDLCDYGHIVQFTLGETVEKGVVSAASENRIPPLRPSW
jgi:hypothetical protein